MSEHPNVAMVRSTYEAVEQGDLEAFAAVLDPDVVWHESMPGFEGTYQGRDEALALLGRVFAETGMELISLTIHRVFADDGRAVVLLDTTFKLDGQVHTTQYVDVYRVRDGKATEHWHLALDPQAEAEIFAGTS